MAVAVVAAAVPVAGRADAANPPRVSIVAPASGTATNAAAVTVVVAFHAPSNLKTLVLLADGREVGRYENAPSVKDGTHGFRADRSAFGDGRVTLQAVGYQRVEIPAASHAMHEENAAAVDAALLDFLRQHARPT